MTRATQSRTRRRARLAAAMGCALALAIPTEVAARGGFARGGGFGGAGLRGGGGFSRGGVARGGSIGGYERMRAGNGGGGFDGGGLAGRDGASYGEVGDSRSRQGSFETRRGGTVDWDGSVTRTDDGFDRETSWQSSSGASGSGSSSVRVDDGRVQGADRSRHVETADGETLDGQVTSKRKNGAIEREGSIETSTGVDAKTEGRIEKTDDGFVAQRAVSGKHGAAAGTIVKDGDDVYGRGVRTDGDDVTWGRVHCSDGHCTGGRVTADIDDYYRYPYYYHPYYYGWYSCPLGSVHTWYGAYGTPIYGCSDTVIVHTTIALGPGSPSAAGSSGTGGGGSTRALREAQVASASVLRYEIDPAVVVYSSSYGPKDVYARKRDGRFFWALGPSKASDDAKSWIARAEEMSPPTANATVITYAIGPRTVYLTNERPAPGFFSEPSDQLFAWIPGVREPNDDERDAIHTAVTAQRAGGQAALDRETRKLEQGRAPPPEAAPDSAPGTAS